MPRVSEKLLKNTLRRAAEALGMRAATKWNDVGAVTLEQSYGGVQVAIITSEGGGISMLGTRMRATDMVDALSLVADMAWRAKQEPRTLKINPRKRRRSRKTTRKNPPASGDSPIRAMEKRIVKRFVTDAIKAGHRIAVSLERGYDVKEMLKGSTDVAAIMAEAFAGDEAHIFVQPATGPMIQGGQVVSDGWVYIVLGNDGYDVIADYTTNLEPLLKGANELAEKLGA